MDQPFPAYQKIYSNYLLEMAGLDFQPLAEPLGITVEGNAAYIPFMGQTYRVSAQGITDQAGRLPHLMVCVVLCKYLMLCPPIPAPHERWVAYREFKDAGPYAAGFLDTATNPIEKNFSGRVGELAGELAKLGAAPSDMEGSYDLKMELPSLPRVPNLVLFNDAESPFPAQCSLLFRDNADQYLDPECLAILGIWLAVALKGGPSQ